MSKVRKPGHELHELSQIDRCIEFKTMDRDQPRPYFSLELAETMRRLDSRFSILWNKGLIYVLLTPFWVMAISGSMTGNPRAVSMYYFLIPLSIVAFLALRWLSGCKQATLAGDTLIIHRSGRDTRIPISQIEQIREPGAKDLQYILIRFKSDTEFGRSIQIMTGYNTGPIVKKLRNIMDGKKVIIKIHPASDQPLPSGSNVKEITVSGWTDEELSGILGDFADEYEGHLGHNFDVEILRDNKGFAHVTFPHDIPAKQFSFLVNYLQYPKDYDLKTRSISVVGKAILSPEFHLPDKSLAGHKAVFYIPSNDQDYDLVYVRVGDQTFVNSFAALKWKKVSDPRMPPDLEIS